MKRHFSVFAALCLSIATVSAVLAAPVASAATAEQFLRGLYAKYTPNGKPTPFVYPDAKGIADSAMLALLKGDRDKSKGEVGAMDSDPICRCQDWNALKVISLHATTSGGAAAVADVAILDDGHVEKIHFALVWLNGGWRIHDIGTKDEPSLVAYLRNYKY
jgi:Protein of unknown function (DUF3828)